MRAQRAGLFLLLLLAAAPGLPADAASAFRLCARVYWADERGMREDARDDLLGVGRDWKWEGERLVYTGEAAAGAAPELMQGVAIPQEWGNEMAGERIFLVIEAVLQQDPGASEIQYGSLHPVICEYQKNLRGEEEPYVNGKTVLPGEKVSKIVRIRLAASGAPDKSTDREGAKDRTQRTAALIGSTDAVVIPIGGSGGEVHLPASGAALPSIQKSRAAPAGEADGVRSAKTADAFRPLAFAAGILAGLAVLVLWFLTCRRRE